MAIEEVQKNKSAKRPNFHKGSLSHSPSQTNGDAKVQINSEKAIPKLQKLAETYFGVSDPHRFLTDLRVALGIPDSQGASKYGVVSIPKEDGSILQASLRVTNHQANANTYIDHDANYKYNLSIVVRRKQRKNTFIPNENVILDEYVYYGTKMQGIENPLTQIVNGIIVFLQSGEYKDTTGVAFKNQSVESKDRVPQNISVDNDGNYVSANAWGADYVSENKQYKRNTIMNKKLIRLTENDLHRIVKRSVNKVLRESYNDDDVYMSNYRDAMSDREDTYTIDDLFSELKEEGYDFLKHSYPDAWHPGNWMQVMQVAEKLGYPEDIKELIIHEIELNISFEQKNLDYVKNYKWRI